MLLKPKLKIAAAVLMVTTVATAVVAVVKTVQQQITEATDALIAKIVCYAWHTYETDVFDMMNLPYDPYALMAHYFLAEKREGVYRAFNSYIGLDGIAIDNIALTIVVPDEFFEDYDDERAIYSRLLVGYVLG